MSRDRFDAAALTGMGRLMLGFLGTSAECKRALIAKRKAGLKCARKKGTGQLMVAGC